MTNQEVFDKSAKHLLTQGVKSVRTYTEQDPYSSEMYAASKCMYRGQNGAQCALGCLITDEQYSPKMEDLNPQTLLKKFVLPQFNDVSVYLLADLQCIHDNNVPAEWRQKLGRLAGKHGLNADVLEA
jgi:hypothetical protein